jgi:hypothetical protein
MMPNDIASSGLRPPSPNRKGKFNIGMLMNSATPMPMPWNTTARIQKKYLKKFLNTQDVFRLFPGKQ